MSKLFYPELLELIEQQKEICIAHDDYYLSVTRREENIFDYIFIEDDECSYHQKCTGHFVLEGIFITESSVFDKYENGFEPDIDTIMHIFFTPEIPTLYQLAFHHSKKL